MVLRLGVALGAVEPFLAALSTNLHLGVQNVFAHLKISNLIILLLKASTSLILSPPPLILKSQMAENNLDFEEIEQEAFDGTFPDA